MSVKKIPYGIGDYRKIKEEDMLYIDKTKYIEVLESLNTPYPVFLRPRRFGKTLLVSTLQHYYDINTKENFEKLFKDTYIGKNPTGLACSYYVMRFNFSGLSAQNMESLIWSFRKAVEDGIIGFENKYRFQVEYDMEEKDPARLLGTYLTNIYPYTKKKVYIMVDEYDHFANGLLHDKKVFADITGKDGFVRQFYEIFKYHTESGCIDRIFITGVTSLTLDSLTSGFNIAKNISMFPKLNEMAGFTKEEVGKVLEEQDIEDAEKVLQLLEDNYNGYLFHIDSFKKQDRVFNSNMVLYFLDEYQLRGNIPKQLTDPNMKTDYDKLTSMFQLLENEKERQRILEDIMSGNGIESDIVTNFNFARSFAEADFLSMLFYLGLLTIKGEGKGFEVVLQTPNAVIRDIYYQYYASYLKLDRRGKREAVIDIAYKDDFSELNKMIVNILKLHSNEDYRGFDEARLKSVFLSCFSEQGLYLVKSEYPAEGKKIDIALFGQRGKDKEIKYNYLIELKYIKKAEADDKIVNRVKEEAVLQMEQYLSLDEFKSDPRVKGLVYIIVKDEIVSFKEI